MTAQLCSEYGGVWPSDHLAQALPPMKRVLYNHALLRLMKEKEEAARTRSDPEAASKRPSTESGGATAARIRARRANMEAESRRTRAEYERRANIIAKQTVTPAK